MEHAVDGRAGSCAGVSLEKELDPMLPVLMAALQ